MWVWNFVLWLRNNYLGSFYPTCNDAANFYADCFRYLGYFFLAVLGIGIFALLCSRLRPKDDLSAGFAHNPLNPSTATYGNNPALNVYGSNADINKGGNSLYGDKNVKVR